MGSPKDYAKEIRVLQKRFRAKILTPFEEELQGSRLKALVVSAFGWEERYGKPGLAIAGELDAIVVRMEVDKGNGGNGEEPPPVSEIRVSGKDHGKVFGYPVVAKAPRVEFREDAVGVWGKRAMPVHPAFAGTSQGTLWVVAEVKPDRWLASSYEWSRPNDDDHDWKTLKVHEEYGGNFLAALIGHTEEPDFEGWEPEAGDLVGWFRSSVARHGQHRNVPKDERVRLEIAWAEIPEMWL
jgi:hypothetical protein